MKKIIFTGDFLYNSEKQNKEQLCLYFKIFEPIIRSVVDDSIELTFDIVNVNNEKFSREKFFALNAVYNLKNIYNQYNVNKFNSEQLNYLKDFFNKDTIVIAFELYQPLCNLLTSFGCKVLDFAFHSYKLFNDNTFAIYSNDVNVYKNLLKYKVPQDRFFYYARYWQVYMQANNMIEDEDIEENSCIFVGQTLQDKSVEKDGVYLNVTHFEEKLKELSKEYSKIYYIPHPYLGGKRKTIYNWVKKCPYIELLTNRSTYGLLASNKISKVVAISTSVLYEAQYFEKEVEYLYKPLFNIDVPFEQHSYVSIHEDMWNPKFWADILSQICKTKNNVPDVNYFKGSSNMLRNIRDTYWGYAQLDPIRNKLTIKQYLKQIYMKYIAPLF